MSRFLFIFFLLLFSLPIKTVHASDRPAIVLNFASINELDWAAPEDTWQKEILPKIEKEVLSMHERLTPSRQSPDTPILGWSTLIEYMNYPLDTPGPTSPYVIKVGRIFQIANKLQLPVFLPLNGFQWWDELPELYNHWDSDGTKTDPKFFARQDNPQEFKKRFIAGYNPDNIWNVEWQSAKTPMKLNYRNWGGGGFRLAPPPNIFDHDSASLTYRSVQRDRLRALLQVIAVHKDSPLFLGLSIGTEVSLNASVTPADEFAPYGYRSTADSGLSREQVVASYLEDNARLAALFSIPKNRIYTHVLGEQDPDDPHFGSVASAAFNLYSYPGVSLYGYAKNPTGSKSWMRALSQARNPTWGILEYNAGESAKDWKSGLLQAVQKTKITIIYNWDGLSKNAYTPITDVLSTPVQPSHCIPIAEQTVVNKGLTAAIDKPVLTEDELPYGVYSSTVQKTCANGQTEYSLPVAFAVPPRSDSSLSLLATIIEKLFTLAAFLRSIPA